MTDTLVLTTTTTTTKKNAAKSASNAYKRQIIRIACELHYPHTVIQKIHNAKTDHEVTRIMTTARHKYDFA